MLITITFREGPLKGSQSRHEIVEPLILGRAPETGGVTLPGDTSVSRKHGELRFENGRVHYRNLSSGNPTLINGKLVTEGRALAPGDRLKIGSEHLFEVTFAGAESEKSKGGILHEGPFANPLLRIGLGAYLAAMLVAFVYFALSDTDLNRDWHRAREIYQTSYTPEGLSAEEKASRLDRADLIVSELHAYEATERWAAARIACEELMVLDRDPNSPLFRFAARQRGRLKH